VYAQAVSNESHITDELRNELYGINYIRNATTLQMEDIIDVTDRAINTIYRYSDALSIGNAASAKGWKSILESQYSSLLAARSKIYPGVLQMFLDASPSFSSSVKTNKMLTPTELVQGLDTLISGVAYSVYLLESDDPLWLDHHTALGDYYLVLWDNVKRYNLIAGEITSAILLNQALPYVITFSEPCKTLPSLEVPWTTPPASLPPVTQQPSSLLQPPSGVIVAPVVPTTPAVIESYIDGEFEGWDGDTVFVLTNGQIWQQDEFSYHYSYAYRPKVLIYRNSSGGYTMRVEGVNKELRVKRIK